MQAQRKLIDPAVLRGPAPPAVDEEGWAPRPAEAGVTPQSSPAHMLLLELSARLQQPAPAAAAMTAPTVGKLPMPARIAVILGLSVATWAAIGLAALRIL